MAKFHIYVSQLVTIGATVEVEADNVDAAHDAALEKVKTGEVVLVLEDGDHGPYETSTSAVELSTEEMHELEYREGEL